MSTIDDVKARLDIVDVVSQYVALSKAGHNFKATCPFHTEKTPSFIVFPDGQNWHCFGACATGGDVFSFVMRAEKLDFGDALKLLAQRTGISLPQRKQESENDVLFQINEAAAIYFSNLLASPQGKGAISYLKGRGVNSEAVSTFRLGLSPLGRDDLKQHLLALGFTEDRVLEAGLLHRREDSSIHDLFRGRLMFPIHDRQGRIVGFGGRSLDGSEPKYLNSPKTPVFDKGGTLYALHLAAEAIRKEGLGVIVEGYMDAIAAHQHGFRNVVASMGTALTSQQVAQLRRLCNSFVLALDPDAAGQEATLRSLESSWKAFELEVIARSRKGYALYAGSPVVLKVALLPQGKDPDQVIKEMPDQWHRLVAQAVPWQDFSLSAIASKYNLKTSEGQAQTAQAIKAFLQGIEDDYQRDRFFQKSADLLGVDVRTLEASIGHPSTWERRRQKRGPAQPAAVSPFEAEKHDRLEEYTLALLLQRPELNELMMSLSPECFHRTENREMFTSWIKCSKIEILRDSVGQVLKGHVDYLMGIALPPMDMRRAQKSLADCARRLEERHLKELKAQEATLLAGQELAGLEAQILAHNDRLKQIFGQAIPQRVRR